MSKSNYFKKLKRVLFFALEKGQRKSEANVGRKYKQQQQTIKPNRIENRNTIEKIN